MSGLRCDLVKANSQNKDRSATPCNPSSNSSTTGGRVVLHTTCSFFANRRRQCKNSHRSPSTSWLAHSIAARSRHRSQSRPGHRCSRTQRKVAQRERRTPCSTRPPWRANPARTCLDHRHRTRVSGSRFRAGEDECCETARPPARCARSLGRVCHPRCSGAQAAVGGESGAGYQLEASRRHRARTKHLEG